MIEIKIVVDDTMPNSKKYVWVDMDGTLAAWNDNSIEALLERGYFLNLKPNFALIEELKHLNQREDVEIYILSCYLTESVYAKAEKLLWCEKHIPFIPKNHIFLLPCGINKAKFLYQRGFRLNNNCFLIDDYNKNLKEWEKYGGVGIKCINTVNDKNHSWDGLRYYGNLNSLLEMKGA